MDVFYALITLRNPKNVFTGVRRLEIGIFDRFCARNEVLHTALCLSWQFIYTSHLNSSDLVETSIFTKTSATSGNEKFVSYNHNRYRLRESLFKRKSHTYCKRSFRKKELSCFSIINNDLTFLTNIENPSVIYCLLHRAQKNRKN